MTKKKNSMISAAKETMGVGVASMAGYGVMGSMGSIPGMPAGASNVTNIAGAGLQLANVGQLAKTGMGLTSMMSNNTQKKSKTKDARLKKMLG